MTTDFIGLGTIVLSQTHSSKTAVLNRTGKRKRLSVVTLEL